MNRTALSWTLLLAAGLSAGPLHAVIGALDQVPAATLLLPYFEVDLDNPNGETTLISLANAGEAPVIAHVILYSDLSVATISFNIYLTGFDNLTFDLRTLFTTGVVPSTSHSNLGISPVGSFSLSTNPTTGVGPGSTSCNGQLPLPQLPSLFLDHIRQAHTGLPSAMGGGLCSGLAHGDNVARGYITIDSVSSCTLDLHGDTGYFLQGGTGAANNLNSLLGDYVYLNPSANRAEGHPMVHLEASSTDPSTQPGQYTFYARYSGGTDNRESLGTSFWTRYAASTHPTETSSLLYWRDSKRVIQRFNCGLTNGPAPFPLSVNQIAIFDDAENPDVPETSPFSPAIPGDFLPFAWESGRVEVGSANFPVGPSAGWMLLNMNNVVAGSVLPFEPLMQNWLGVSFEASSGQYRFGYDAFPLDTAANGTNSLMPRCDGTPDPEGCGSLPLFADGFESGDTSEWSLQVP